MNFTPFKRVLASIQIGLIYGIFLLSFTGAPQIAYALSCDDTWILSSSNIPVTYRAAFNPIVSYGGKTYGVAEGTITLSPTKNIEQIIYEPDPPRVVNGERFLYPTDAFGDARFPTINSDTVNEMLKNLSTASTAAGEGVPLPIINKYDGKGFVNMSSATAISYSKWAPGHPLTNAQCGSYQGFPYAYSGTDGLWRSACTDTVKKVFELPSLDCATPYNVSAPPPAATVPTGVIGNSSTCDTATFERHIQQGGYTYAITKQPMTWDEAKAAAENVGGTLAVIKDSELNTKLAQSMAPAFTVNQIGDPKAWIGLSDPLRQTNYCTQAQAAECTPDPSRFVWATGTSSFKNWGSQQPDNKCTRAEQALHPEFSCFGENWATINPDGTWSDEGDHADHAVAPLKLKAIAMWQGIQDCVANTAPETSADPIGLDTSAGNWCTNQAQTTQKICEKTKDGGEICPEDQVVCTSVVEEPVCPAGTSLNATRDMCQTDPTVSCGDGYSWDSTIDTCVADAVCPEGGILNSQTDKCEKTIQVNCADGYTYDTNPQSPSYHKCVKSVECESGAAYVHERNRCEKPIQWACPSGFSVVPAGEGAVCEKTPTCALGSVYNNTRNRCESAVSACPNGYTYNTVMDQCIADVTCATGSSFNATTAKCETVPSTSCPGTMAFNAATGKCEEAPVCPTPGTYDAASNLCLTSATTASCPTGYTYDTASQKCFADPTCGTGGTFNATTDRCEASVTCTDSSYVFNATKGRCEKVPSCPTGMTYSATYNVCVQAIKQECPTGYIFNATRNKCEKQPVCPTDTVYNATTNRCEATPECVNSTYDEVKDACSRTDYPLTCLKKDGDWCVIADISSRLICYEGKIICNNVDISPYAVPEYVNWNSDGNWEAVNFTVPAFVGEYSIYYMTSDDLSVNIKEGSTVLLNKYNGSGGSGTFTDYNDGTVLSGHVWGDDRDGNPMLTLKYKPAPTDTPAACATGTILDKATDKCVASPTCSGGSFDGTNDVCYVNYTPACAQGTYDSTTNLCVSTPTCSNGSLDGTVDKCYQAGSGTCPTGYTASGSTCIASATCPQNGTLANDRCTVGASWSCPTGYSYSSSTGKCYKTPTCNAGSLNAPLDVCQVSLNTSCPASFTLTGGVCQGSFSCTTGGTYDSPLALCKSTGSICSSPSALDTALDICHQPATCPTGSTLDPTKNVCTTVATFSCGTATTDTTNGVCASPAICTMGGFDSTTDRCVGAITTECGTYTANGDVCQLAPTCPKDVNFPFNNTIAYSGTFDQCVSQADHDCITGTTYTGLPHVKCEAVPICKSGIYNASNDSCSTGNSNCPIGEFECKAIEGRSQVIGCAKGNLNPDGKCEWDEEVSIPATATTGADGTTTYSCTGNQTLLGVNCTETVHRIEDPAPTDLYYCSPNECKDKLEVEVDDTPTGANDLKNDGTISDDGQCSGQFYIFNGEDNRCVKKDMLSAYIAITKLVASLVMSAFGVPAMALLLANMAMTVAGDLATGNFGMGTLISVGVSVVAAALPALGGMIADSAVGEAFSSLTKQMASAWNEFALNTLGAESLMVSVQAMAAAGTEAAAEGAAQSAGQAVTESFAQQLVRNVSEATGISQEAIRRAGTAATQAAGGMLSSFGPTKCCYPDPLSGSCKPEEHAQAEKAGKGFCHIVGTYCSRKLLGSCMTQKETSCCFSSVIARIFHEQGRPQLAAFGENSWGDPKNPNCRGFTPEEFQMLDMSQINLQEYTDGFLPPDAAALETKFKDNADAFIQEQQEAPVVVTTPDPNAPLQ